MRPSLAPEAAELDADCERESERCSLDTELGRRLSQLSRSAKFAVALNQIQRVKMCATYEREDATGDVITVYVLDVFLKYVQKGLPKTPEQSGIDRLRWKQHERDEEHAEFQVEHRYSAFRELRQRILEVVDTPKDRSHPKWCVYCSRVRSLVASGLFPPRYPNRGRVAICTGWRGLLVHTRQKRLEAFVNQLLRAAKDVSYRSGCGQCERFGTVSKLLSDFLAEPHLRTSGSVW
ncbi:hypothetical protein BBJ28_00012085 [Nothophytophthora sp. Chile5]|nr:hypothetical protein BBJ28_00012085 [Nothophytophthora sp. Chile5]